MSLLLAGNDKLLQLSCLVHKSRTKVANLVKLTFFTANRFFDHFYLYKKHHKMIKFKISPVQYLWKSLRAKRLTLPLLSLRSVSFGKLWTSKFAFLFEYFLKFCQKFTSYHIIFPPWKLSKSCQVSAWQSATLLLTSCK